jgi:23S rRNA (cytidine2498-2'-O)-methyltransferase
MPADSESQSSNPPSQFVFVVCQHGAETAAKKEITTEHPNLRLAFSRPGFLTFKVDAAAPLPEKFTLKSTLARTYGWSLGRATGTDGSELVNEIFPHIAENIRTLHVWERDGRMPGKQGFEPGLTVLANEVGNLLAAKIADAAQPTEIAHRADVKPPISVNEVARVDAKVFDVVLVEPDQWWYGYHFATTVPGRWPGGVPLIDTSVETISRAYFKAQEALLWSGIEIQPGDWCAEIGSSPGGCCQLLLELGANVIGVDPAVMDPDLLKHENFTHIRRRGNEIRKRDLKDVKWLFADLSMVPNYTLDTVSEIVSHASVDVKGLLLTMKLTDWKLMDDIPALMTRVREMGFSVVKSRQLAFNRQEFCLVAVKDKFVLRLGKKQTQQKQRGR